MRFMLDPRVWRELECPYGESPFWVDAGRVSFPGGDRASAFENQRWRFAPPPRRFITDGLALDDRPKRRWSPPAALLDEFIRRDASEDHFRHFASKYGLLGGDLQNIGEIEGRRIVLESYEDWADEHATLCNALNELRPATRRVGVLRSFPPEFGEARPEPAGDHAEVEWFTGDLPLLRALRRAREHPSPSGLHAARTAVAAVVNSALAKGGRARVEIHWEGHAPLGTFRVVPICLIGLLWLDLAIVVTKSIEHRQCAVCGEWFIVTGTRPDRNSPTRPSVKRADAAYCSPYCRLKAYRREKAKERHQEARLLVRAGISVEEVARTLGARVSNVRRWLETEE